MIKFESPTTVLVSGPTSSGKSTLVFDILKHAKDMFQKPPKKIFYCYGIFQPTFTEMEREISNIEFIDGLPTRNDLHTWSAHSDHNILVLDDLLQKAAKNEDIVDLFCQYSHHLNFTTFFLVQNLFSGGKFFRTISLNSHFILLFANARDTLQIQTLARQIFPSSVNYFMDAFHKSTEPRFGYLLIDCHPKSDPLYKLRTHILPHQITSVFVPKKST